MLATLRESGPPAWLQSFTRPVAGFASSQKNWKQARSTSSKKPSSSGVNRYRVGSPPLNSAASPSAGGGVICGAGATCEDCAACSRENALTPSGAPAAAREASHSHSRREILGAFTRISQTEQARATRPEQAGSSTA